MCGSTEAEPAEKPIDDRTLRLGAYGENFVTSTLSTVGYNNLIAISTIYDGLFAKDFETGEILCGLRNPMSSSRMKRGRE